MQKSLRLTLNSKLKTKQNFEDGNICEIKFFYIEYEFGEYSVSNICLIDIQYSPVLNLIYIAVLGNYTG